VHCNWISVIYTILSFVGRIFTVIQVRVGRIFTVIQVRVGRIFTVIQVCVGRIFTVIQVRANLFQQLLFCQQLTYFTFVYFLVVINLFGR
jgi:hypothetical protein